LRKTDLPTSSPEERITQLSLTLTPPKPRHVAVQPSVGRIPSLDGLRGIAILMVLLAHGKYQLPTFLNPVVRFAGNGSLGVKLFFVLSGYLIYHLSAKETNTFGTFNWKQFYIRRALRIFPCLYFYILVLLMLKGCGLLPGAVSSELFIHAA
jgi:peptidoglycan/LPS O-acetylase OafA/YrhL